jgi:hypothetical protein
VTFGLRPKARVEDIGVAGEPQFLHRPAIRLFIGAENLLVQRDYRTYALNRRACDFRSVCLNPASSRVKIGKRPSMYARPRSASASRSPRLITSPQMSQIRVALSLAELQI